MNVGRTSATSRAMLATLVLALVSLVSLQGATPAQADPGSDLKASKKKVDDLYAQACSAWA